MVRIVQQDAYASFRRALQLFDHFAADRPEMSLSELALKMEMHRSTVLRLTKAFEASGFLERDERTRKYRLGVRLYELGSMYARSETLHQIAARALPELSESSGFTSYLCVLDEQDLVIIDMKTGPSGLQVVVLPGRRMPAHIGAAGKAALATLSDEQIRKIYANGVPRYPRARNSSVTDLLGELKRIRQCGYATTNSEWNEGVFAIGVAIGGALSARPAGLALAFPAHPAPTPKKIEALAELLIKKASEIRGTQRPNGADTRHSNSGTGSRAKPPALDRDGRRRAAG